MIADLVILGLAVKVSVSAVRRGKKSQASPGSTTSTGGGR
jgi:hypothetical protein